MKRFKKLTLQALLYGTGLLLAACATTTAIDAIERHIVCKAWQPTYWKYSWPDDALTQGKDNNGRRASMCETVPGDPSSTPPQE